MSDSKQRQKSMSLAGTVSIPPRLPRLANISFEFEENMFLIVATEDLSPKLQIKRTFFAHDVKAIFYPANDKRVDAGLTDGKWVVGDGIRKESGARQNKKSKLGIIYVSEHAQSQLEVQAGLTAAESAEYFPPLPDDRSVNHYDMVGCDSFPGPMSPGGMIEGP